MYPKKCPFLIEDFYSGRLTLFQLWRVLKMRVKLLLALAIASVLLFCSIGVAAAATISGVPTAEQLTSAADQQCNACGFPDLGAIGTSDPIVVVPQDTIDATSLTSPLCGVCGEIPDCNVEEETEVIPGPQVNLGCPLITTVPIPVDLESPEIEAEFPCIDVAPQVVLGLPQVNLGLNCFDIACQPVTNFNECPVPVFD
jgi:hypothetical protein